MDAHAARKRASAEGRVQNARSTLGCGRAGMNLEALVGRLHRAAHCDREDLPAKMDMTRAVTTQRPNTAETGDGTAANPQRVPKKARRSAGTYGIREYS
jgi:hypothetical protein